MKYDICIIGSGPAGLTLCNELSLSGKTICVIESGGKILDPENTALKKVTSSGEIKIKNNSRERALGGTSNTWSGLSAPLDPIDLERWPITLNELEPYYQKLDAYGFAPFKDFDIRSFDEIKKKGNLPLPLDQLKEKIFIASDPPINFGTRFANLFENPNITLLLNMTVLELLQDEHGNVCSASVANLVGTRSTIEAGIFIICAGGLESARLLLINDLGNEYDQVGRYLMNHPKGNDGILELRNPVRSLPAFFGIRRKGFHSYIGLQIQDEVQKKLNILNGYIRLEPVYPKTFFGRLLRRFGGRLTPIRTIRLRNFMEMEPDPENKMILGSERDRYGNPLPVVNMHTTEHDRRSLVALHDIFKVEVQKSNTGTFTSTLKTASPWPISLDASHHLGGTVMGTNPKISVVDTNLKVHSVRNLYVCSGSVFPSSGCANPTYTICALAVRLANHLKTL